MGQEEAVASPGILAPRLLFNDSELISNLWTLITVDKFGSYGLRTVLHPSLLNLSHKSVKFILGGGLSG